MRGAHFSQRASALGVVLHVADEFALAEVTQGNDGGVGGEDLGILHYNLIEDPCEILVDKEVSVATTSWRLLPFWGAGPEQERCTAIALSRSREAFLQNLIDLGTEWRVPIRVAVTSAALETLAALPLIEPTSGGGRLVVVTYLKFTAVFAVSALGELRSVRSLLHRGSQLVPMGFGDILWNMAISAELTTPGKNAGTPPQVLLLSDNPAALQAAAKDLEAYSQSRQTIEFEMLDLSTHQALDAIPGRRPEFLVYDVASLAAARTAGGVLSQAQTFRTLWTDWLGKCNFFDTGKVDSVYPTLSDLRLLRCASILVAILTLGMLGTAANGFYSLFQAMNHPSWSLTPMEVKRTEGLQAKLAEEKKQIEITSRLLQPRSRGWVAMEFLLQLFPEDAGVRVDSFSYNFDVSRPVGSPASSQTGANAGLVRSWNIRGAANTQTLELLNALNSQRGLSELFSRVAKTTGDPGYKVDALRQLTVTQNQGRNPKYNAAASPSEVAADPLVSLPYNFEATITQTFSEKDVLALPTEKPF